MTLMFRSGYLYLISLCCVDSSIIFGEEQKRKELHDNILSEYGLSDDEEFIWGSINSVYNPKSNISSINVFFYYDEEELNIFYNGTLKNANHSSCSSVDNNIVSMSPNNNSEIDSSNINMKNTIVKKKNDKKEPLKDYLHCILKREIYAYNDIFKSNPNIIETFRKEFKSFLKTLNYIDNRDIEVERFFLFLHKNNFTISKLVAKKHGKEYLFSQLKYALELSDTYFNMYLYPKYEEFS